MQLIFCPKCNSKKIVKSGIIKNRQRYKCNKCSYHFSVPKLGKQIDNYYVVKALQLYLEGISFREIERLLGVSHTSVMNWVKKYRIYPPENYDYHPTYRIFNYQELLEYFKEATHLKGAGMIITEIGDKFMLIKWERFKD